MLLELYFKKVGGGIQSQYTKLKTASLVYATKGMHFIMYGDFEWYIQKIDKFISLSL